MELVDFSRKHNVLELLQELFDNVENHYNQHQSLIGLMDTQTETILGEEDGYIVKLSFFINDASQQYINVYASIHFEDENGDVVATDDNDVDVNLTIDKIHSLKLFLDSLNRRTRIEGIRKR